VSASLATRVPHAGAAALELDEIVVTAQKREQRLQDVPVAVSAISGETIASQGITRIEGIAQLAPSLNVTAGIKSTQAGISIRGIGNNSTFGSQVEPAVLVVFDDVSQVQSGQAFSTMIDVERIEVLRGPQNTLFGKNASAGVVNIVSRVPSDEFEASTELTATDDDEQAISGTLSGPLSDTLGYRLTGYYSDLGGYISNIEGGDDLHDRESQAFRGKLRWQPSDDLDVTLSANYMDIDERCCSMVPTYWDPRAAFLAPAPLGVLLTDMLPGLKQDKENDKTGRDDGDHQSSDNTGASLKLDYRLGEHTLTSISAYNEWSNRAGNDIDFSGRDVPGDLAGLYGVRSWDDADRNSDFVSQELRLASPAGETLDYIVGAYYSKSENDERYQRFSEIPPLTENTDGSTETEGYAAFGQADWHFTDATTLSLGVRYNTEEISAEVQDLKAGGVITGDDDDSVWLGKLSLQHQLLDDTMVYATVSTGYKGQAFDTSGFTEEKAENPVQPEESVNYELGVKSVFADGRFQINADTFFTAYDDFQAQHQRVNENGATAPQLLNVGNLETYGVELDAAAMVVENLRLSLGAAYTHAEVTEWDDAPCYALQTVAEGCNKVASVEPSGKKNFVQASAEGNELPMAPEWRFTLNGDYLLPLADMPFDFFANANYIWQDDTYYDIKGSPRSVQDAYGVANLSLGIVENTSERYRVTAFVNNVFDEFYSGQVTDGLSGTAYTQLVMMRIPVRSERYAGLRVKLSW
jgi:iron complex outermembrane receptor protein